MTDLPTRRGLGRTRVLLTLLAVLVLGTAVGAVAYAARQPEPRAAEPRAGPTTPAPRSASPDAPPSASPSALPQPSAPVPPRASPQGTRRPDAVARPVPADPAGAPRPVPPPARDAPPTCGQWRDLLSGEQRASYAAGQLAAAWRNDGSADDPPARTVRAFGSAITAACAGKAKANGNVSDVARAVYAADPGTWGP